MLFIPTYAFSDVWVNVGRNDLVEASSDPTASRGPGSPPARRMVFDAEISDGNWHHVAVTWQRTGLTRVYLDGEEKRPLGNLPPLISPATDRAADGAGAHALSITSGASDPSACRMWEIKGPYRQGNLFWAFLRII